MSAGGRITRIAAEGGKNWEVCQAVTYHCLRSCPVVVSQRSVRRWLCIDAEDYEWHPLEFGGRVGFVPGSACLEAAPAQVVASLQ